MNLKICALSAGVMLTATHASALTIVPDFSKLGTVYSNAAGNLSNVSGQGQTDVTSAFENVATFVASTLSKAVGVRWTESVSIELNSIWGGIANSSINATDVNGRPTRSEINVDTNTAYFIDPTPADNSEFAIGSKSATLGGGSVNVSRIGNAVAGSAAVGKWDLVTVLLHEMEHSIAYNAGMARYSSLFDNGSFVIPTSLTGLPTSFDIPLTPGSHIDGQAQNGLFNDTVIAEPGFGGNQRALLTDVEIYGACYVEGCSKSQVNLNPYGTNVSAVPLPATSGLMLAGLAALFALPRFLRSARGTAAPRLGA